MVRINPFLKLIQFLVFFILSGSIVLYVDLNDQALGHNLISPDKMASLKLFSSTLIMNDNDAFNVPFNLIVEGSYFGDSDCLYQNPKKCIRESTAEADKACQLLLIKKKALEDLLTQFSDVKSQMRSIVKEKKRYYQRLI
jgi:CRP-like cAMP-binding protein